MRLVCILFNFKFKAKILRSNLSFKKTIKQVRRISGWTGLSAFFKTDIFSDRENALIFCRILFKEMYGEIKQIKFVFGY